MLKIIVATAAILIPGAALAEDWGKFYAEVYGGASLGTDTQYNGVDYAMDPTWAAGAAFGVDMGNGFSLGVDIMKTGDAEYQSESATLTTFSVMAEGEYALALKGQIKLESKDAMKKRGLASPDDGDALALTFAEPVSRMDAATARRINRMRNMVADSDYDIFAST